MKTTFLKGSLQLSTGDSLGGVKSRYLWPRGTDEPEQFLAAIHTTKEERKKLTILSSSRVLPDFIGTALLAVFITILGYLLAFDPQHDPCRSETGDSLRRGINFVDVYTLGLL